MAKAHEAAAPLAGDAAEIAKFNKIAAQWWNPHGPMKPLHALNPTRLTFLKRELAAHFGKPQRDMVPFAGLSLLDIGCGAGLITEPMARMGFTVTGIDLAEETITAARLHAGAGGLAITYHAMALDALPEEPSFDAITLLEVVEHVPDVPALLNAAAKRLKPGGILIASTLNRTLKSFALAIIGAEYVLRWLPRGTHDWNRFVTPHELEEALEQAGLTPGLCEGMVFNPLTNQWGLSADCDVNYLMVAVKPSSACVQP